MRPLRKPAVQRTGALRSRRGSAVIETVLITGMMMTAVTFGLECFHLITVQRSVSEITAAAARITKEICPVPNPNNFEHMMSAAYYVEREQMTLAHVRIRKIADSMLPNIDFQQLANHDGTSDWTSSDAYGIPDRSNTRTAADDKKRFGEIIVSSWVDRELREPGDPTTSPGSEPYRVIVSTASSATHNFPYPYNKTNVIPAMYRSLHSSPTLPEDSPVYEPVKRAVNHGMSCSLAEMWYEYRPVTALFQKLLKAATGHEYKVLYAAATA
jgi:hypothetical protein